MKKSALLLSMIAAVGMSLVITSSTWSQELGSPKKKLTAALDDLVKNGKLDPKSVLDVLKTEFLGASRKAAEAKNYAGYTGLRNELLNWIRAGSSPAMNQVILNELEKQVKGMSSTPPGDPVVIQMVLTLNELNSPTSRNLLIGLAGHPDSAVRYLATVGIYKMVSDPNNKVTLTENEVSDLRGTAVKETNGPTLARYQMIFAALSSPTAQDAIVKTLATRVPAWANQDPASAEADRLAVSSIRGFYSSAPPAQRQAIHATLGALLHGVINTYIAKLDQLSDTERLPYVMLIMELEKTCQTVTPDKGSTPSLSDAAKAKDAKMKLQMAGPQWWGEPGTKGIMEAAPWNLPSGGGLPAAMAPEAGTKPASMPASKPAA